jgi:hypothetical protein
MSARAGLPRDHREAWAMARGMLQFPPSRAAPIFDKWKATVESLFYFLEEGCPGGTFQCPPLEALPRWRPRRVGAASTRTRVHPPRHCPLG